VSKDEPHLVITRRQAVEEGVAGLGTAPVAGVEWRIELSLYVKPVAVVLEARPEERIVEDHSILARCLRKDVLRHASPILGVRCLLVVADDA
jgi:hypothetical protein